MSGVKHQSQERLMSGVKSRLVSGRQSKEKLPPIIKNQKKVIVLSSHLRPRAPSV